MKLLIAAAIVAAFSLAQAKEVGRFLPAPHITVRLFDERGECPHEKLVRVELHVHGKKMHDGCAYDDGSVVFIKWDDNDIGQVRRDSFKPGV